MSAEEATTPVPLKAKVVAEKPVEEKGLSDITITKYQGASTIVASALAKLIPQIVEGKSALELCIEGDKLIEDGTSLVYNSKKVKVTKGLAFPTCISINNVVSHYSPIPSDANIPVLKKGDVVKVQLGAHIDGYPSIHAETVIVGASATEPAEGRSADVIKAAWNAAQAAMRLVKVGEKTYGVTEGVQKVSKQFECTPVEGQLSCQHLQFAPDGPKRIILNPSPDQRKDEHQKTFEEGEVYGVDILVSSTEDGKTKVEDSKTTVYKKSDIIYQLKMKTSRAVFAEIQKKAGAFPFTLRTLEDEKRARVGINEAVQHSLVRPYDIVNTPAGTFVAQFFFTIALLPAGPLIISPTPVWYSDDKVKSTHEVKDEELKTLIAAKLRVDKKKAKKAAKADGAEGTAPAAETKAE